ncbi:hypothetical protein ACGH6R_10660 [Gilliamella sp. CG13]|uniref:hypothetical protein n=1 Tax=Gilliamella sp. CG13 TaxID=3351502 RepID=UPI003985C9ED
MPKIIISERLIKLMNKNKCEYSVRGNNIEECLRFLCEEQSEFEEHLFYPNKILKSHFLISLNDTVSSLDAKVLNDDVIELLIATSGGIEKKNQY